MAAVATMAANAVASNLLVTTGTSSNLVIASSGICNLAATINIAMPTDVFLN